MAFHFGQHVEIVRLQRKHRKHFYISNPFLGQMKFRHAALWFRSTLGNNNIGITFNETNSFFDAYQLFFVNDFVLCHSCYLFDDEFSIWELELLDE